MIRLARLQRASQRWLAIALTAALFSGCNSKQTQLVGTWVSESAKPNPAGQSSPLDAADGTEPDATNSIQLRFYRSGRLDTFTHLPNIQTQKSGKWRFISYNEVTQTAMIEFELMQQRTRHEVEFLDHNTIRLVPPNMAGLSIKMTFKRE